MELTEADAGAERDVAVGSDVVVRLQENATTGFRWRLASPPGGLEPTGDDYQAGDVPGAGGVRRFTLRAAGPGSYRVRAELRRSWET